MMVWTGCSSPTLGALSFMVLFPLLFLGVLSMTNASTLLLEWSVYLLGPSMFEFPLLFDKFSLVFISTVTLITFSVMLFSVSYMSGDKDLEYFIYLVCLFVLSMDCLICVPNLVMLLLGWDGLGLTSFLLVIYYQNSKSLGAGMVTALTNRIGDALLILAGGWSLNESFWELSFVNVGVTSLIGGSIMVGTMTKSAQIPFSAWLPAAMAAPTPVSSLVHSSTLVTAGVYVLIRFYGTLSEFNFFCPFILFSGILTCGMAGLVANYEYDLKKIIALSTLSQLGIMMMSLGMGSPNVAFFHLITHALFKALLFVCAGTVLHSNLHIQDIRLLGNVWWDMPFIASSLNVANLALCGFPFLAGFYSKDLILESFLMGVYPSSTYFLLLSVVCLTAAYSIRLSLFLLWSPSKVSLTNSLDNSVYPHVGITTLLIGAVTGGAFGNWFFFPSLSLIMLPLIMKVFGLLMVMILGVIAGWAWTNQIVWPGSWFMSSMWFLTPLTNSVSVQGGMKVSELFFLNELSWLEILGGKGVFNFVRFSGVSLQRTQNLSVSQMLSLFSVSLLLGLWLI